MWNAEGSWVEKGVVEIEPVTVIEVAHDVMCPENAAIFAKAIRDYGRKAKQDSISIDRGNFYIGQTTSISRAYQTRYGHQ